MNAFIAIILVCAKTVSVASCDESQAVDVLSTRVPNELGCATGWQEVMARSSLREDLDTTYIKTVCRRIRTNDDRRP